MERRGFVGAVVLAVFSLPKIAQRAMMGPPSNAANPVHVPYSHVNVNNGLTTSTVTTWPIRWEIGGAPTIVWR